MLQDAGADVLAPALQQLTELIRLQLEMNHLCAPAMAALAPAMAALAPALQQLTGLQHMCVDVACLRTGS